MEKIKITIFDENELGLDDKLAYIFLSGLVLFVGFIISVILFYAL